MTRAYPVIDYDRCNNCGQCSSVVRPQCPWLAITAKVQPVQGGLALKPTLDKTKCNESCAAGRIQGCVACCPMHAITIRPEQQPMRAAQVFHTTGPRILGSARQSARRHRRR